MNETMVKDLDRPSSEMNIHQSNTLRNSFILEENEEELVEESTSQKQQPSPHDKSKKFSNNSTDDNFDKTIQPANTAIVMDELPFPELVFINLADNQVFSFYSLKIFQE